MNLGIKHTNKHNDKCFLCSMQSYGTLNSSRGAARNISNRLVCSATFLAIVVSRHITTLAHASAPYMPPCLLWCSRQALSPAETNTNHEPSTQSTTGCGAKTDDMSGSP